MASHKEEIRLDKSDSEQTKRCSELECPVQSITASKVLLHSTQHYQHLNELRTGLEIIATTDDDIQVAGVGRSHFPSKICNIWHTSSTACSICRNHHLHHEQYLLTAFVVYHSQKACLYCPGQLIS